MRVIARAATKDGTPIQIEDWHEDYPSLAEPEATLAAYLPVKEVHPQIKIYTNRMPKVRCSFSFGTKEEAREAFESLTSGAKTLKDYKDFLNDDWKAEYL